MAQVRKDNVQVTLTIDGNQAKAELDNLQRTGQALTRELSAMKKGTEEYAKTSKELDKVNERMGQLQDEIGLTGLSYNQLTKIKRDLNKELKNLVPGTEEFINKSKKLQEVEAQLENVEDQMKGVADESKNAVNQLAQIGPVGQLVGQVKGAFGELKGGIGNAATAFKTLGGAIAATGIGLLLVLLGGLVAWFKRTDAGATTLDGIMRSLNATFDVLLNRLFNFQESFTQLLTNPIKFFSELGSDIAQATEDAYGLAFAFDELDEKRRQLDEAEAEASKTITQLLLKSKNVALSYRERIALLDEASKKEEDNFQAQLKYAQEFEAAVLKETELQRQAGTITDEQERKLTDARIARIKLEEESFNLQEKILNRRAALTEKQEAEEQRRREKRQAAEQKAAEKLLAIQQLVADAQRAVDDQRAAMTLSRDEQELRRIDEKYRVLLEKAKGFGDQELELLRLRDEEKALYEQQKKQKEDEEAAAFKQMLDEMLLAEDEAEILRVEQKYQKLIEQAQKFGLDTIALENLRQAEITTIQTNAALRQKAQTDELNRKRIESERATFMALRTVTSQYFEILGQLYSDFGQDQDVLNQFLRMSTLFQIGIDTAQAISNLTASSAKVASAVAVASGPAGVATGPAAYAAYYGTQIIAILKGFAQARQLLGGSRAPGAPTFAKGGAINPIAGVPEVGQLHSGGGIKMIDGASGQMLGEWERGEPYMILSRNTYSNNKDIIDSLINSSLYRNGAPIMARGGIYQNGGVANPGADETMMQALAGLIGRIDERLANGLYAKLVYEQYSSDLQEVSSVINEATA